MTAARLGKLSPPVRDTENQKITDTEAAALLWLPATRQVVLRLTEVSLVARCRITADQGRRLQHLMRRHPRAVTVADALKAEGCTLERWLAGGVGT
jgi:hypothetical protein